MSAAIQGLRLVLLLIAVCFALPGMAGNNVKIENATSVQTVTEVAFRSWLQGTCNLSYTSSAMRMDCPGRGVVFLMKAPDWRMYYYKPSAKIYFECAGKDFNPDEVKTFATMRPSAPGALKPVSYKKDILLGNPCTVCKMVNPQLSSSNGDHLWKRLIVRSGEFWLDNVPGIPEEANRTILRTLGLPYAKGMPLQLKTLNGNGSIDDEIKLYTIKKKKVPPNFFTMPSGFKRVNRPNAVGNNQDPEIYEIMR